MRNIRTSLFFFFFFVVLDIGFYNHLNFFKTKAVIIEGELVEVSFKSLFSAIFF